MKKVEILSPAGSFECLIAAVKSGADAAYVGGNRFGARAFANNFSQEELLDAIDYMHVHGKQLYLTINTLLKETELEKELFPYLEPLYLHGLDAVIVQDMGVLSYLRKQFPNLPIHASTQMTVTNVRGAKFLEAEGVERVVTSRELSVSEVAQIAKETNLEIESFVHGALCYAYSGQCLYSSMIGGRSGNRGQCAQPCRLQYECEGKQGYHMSLKDICALDLIPDLIDAGVFSFKIEGRMKKPEYVASVTAMYRKYVDFYLQHGRKKFHVTEEDKDILRDIFNRGDFHAGYWKQQNGPSMLTVEKPSHTGVAVLQVIGQKGRMVQAKALKVIQPGDIIEIGKSGDNYTFGKAYGKKEFVELSLRKGVSLAKNTILYRTRNQSLIDRIEERLKDTVLKVEIIGTLSLYKGQPMTLSLTYGEQQVTVQGEVVQEAQNMPMTVEKVTKQMKKTGNTAFSFATLEIEMDPDIFLPMQQLNQLRRNGLDALLQAITSQYRRTPATLEQHGMQEQYEIHEQHGMQEQYEIQEQHGMKDQHQVQGQPHQAWHIQAAVNTWEQLEVVLGYPFVTRVYVDCGIEAHIWETGKLARIGQKIHDAEKAFILAMPHIFREQTAQIYEQHYTQIFQSIVDGVLVRNIESYEFLLERGYQGPIYLDHQVYTFNNQAQTFWTNHQIAGTTLPLELNAKELMQLHQKDTELVVYGYTPVMITAQCMTKTIHGCTKQSGVLILKDRLKNEIKVKNYCDYCYNILYNTLPTSILDEVTEIKALQVTSLRVSFTVEDRQQTIQVLEAVQSNFFVKEAGKLDFPTTRGHFRRGIN